MYTIDLKNSPFFAFIFWGLKKMKNRGLPKYRNIYITLITEYDVESVEEAGLQALNPWRRRND